MSDTPGADAGQVIGWSGFAFGITMACALTGDGQTVGAIIAGVGLAIVAFAASTKRLERAVMSGAGSGTGCLGLLLLCALVIVGLVIIGGAGAGVAGVLP